MDLGLKDRVVFVTGGSGAIGAAIARAFADEGARVAVGWYTNQGGADAVISSITASGGAAVSVQLDQGDPISISQAIAQVAEAFSTIDILIGNAVVWPRGAETWESLTRRLVTNVAGTLTMVDEVLPEMRGRGWGRVVLVSSDVVDQPMPAAAGYPAAKGAIEAGGRVLAVREAQHGILTNVVRPGFTLTERALTTQGFGQGVIDAESIKTPTRRICTPEDVASLVVYLASAANGHINGEVISVAGGRHLTR